VKLSKKDVHNIIQIHISVLWNLGCSALIYRYSTQNQHLQGTSLTDTCKRSCGAIACPAILAHNIPDKNFTQSSSYFLQ
jgi:hypothetical protein